MMAKKQQEKMFEKLSRETHFAVPEIVSLTNIFKEYTKDSKHEKMDRTRFRDVLHNKFTMTDDMLMDRVFRAFDKDSDSYVNLSEWIKGLSVFLRGTQEEEMQYCFDVYDLNSDGFISREEMFHMLKNSVVKQPTEEDPDEGVKDLVEIAIKKMDFDHDGRLNYNDYKQAVGVDPLLLEAFGQCLPNAKSKEAFIRSFSDVPCM